MNDNEPILINPTNEESVPVRAELAAWLNISLSDEQLKQLAVYIAEHLLKRG